MVEDEQYSISAFHTYIPANLGISILQDSFIEHDTRGLTSTVDLNFMTLSPPLTLTSTFDLDRVFLYFTFDLQPLPTIMNHSCSTGQAQHSCQQVKILPITL